jgi:hypothetical protein
MEEKILCRRMSDISTAVDDHRNSIITHLARAISIRHFVNQVKQHFPEDTLIPSN